MIASQWHGGQHSELYSFVSTGAITHKVVDEIAHEWAALPEDDPKRHQLELLGEYVRTRDSHEPVEGWSQLWLTTPDVSGRPEAESDRCPACDAHIAEPHSEECPLNPDPAGGRRMKSFKRTMGQRVVDAICDIAKVIAVVVIGLYGDLPIQDLKKAHIDNLMERLQMGDIPRPGGKKRRPSNEQSRRNILSSISQMLDSEVQQGHLPRNVAQFVDTPRLDSAECPTLTVEEMQRVLKHHRERPGRS